MDANEPSKASQVENLDESCHIFRSDNPKGDTQVVDL